MTAPVELVIHCLAVGEQGMDDRTVVLMAPHTPLQYPDSMPGIGGVAVVPRARGDHHISRSKSTPDPGPTLRLKPSALAH